MTKLGALLSLAATGVLSAAAFVRPPMSPVPQAFAQPKLATSKVASPGKRAQPAAPRPVAFATAVGASAKGFMVEQLAFVPYGSAVGELGVLRPKEANPEGPMSLAVDDAGRVHVLDQVNRRVARFRADGAADGVAPIDSDTVQDLALDPRGGYALLDRLVAREVRFVDEAGRTRARVPVVGPGVPDAGLVTGLFSAADGFWVETEHAQLVRVATADGAADPQRPTLAGRRATPTSPLLRAARDPSGYAAVSAMGAFFARVPFDAPVLALVGLEGDAKGTTFVAAHVGRESSTFALYDEKLTVAALNAQGLEVGRFDLPPPEGPEEQLRSIALSPAGALHHLHVGAAGATIWRAR